MMHSKRLSHARRHRQIDHRFVQERAKTLLRHPLFIFLTVVGNGFMLLGATALYWLERDLNPNLNSFLDALWWSVQTVTTVGYGDISPRTAWGKIAGIGLMIFGTALFSAFTALFATVLLTPEIDEVEAEVRELERSVHPE